MVELVWYNTTSHIYLDPTLEVIDFENKLNILLHLLFFKTPKKKQNNTLPVS